jgi:hypothetical protein
VPRVAPATPSTAAANIARNARAERDRLARWRSVRDHAWAFVDPYLPEGGRVAVVGAGKAHTLPLTRLAARAGSVDLLDVDPVSARQARRRTGRRLRRRIRVHEHDVTLGAAQRVLESTVARRTLPVSTPEPTPLPGAPYDLVVGDLFYSQLLYPGLHDAGVPDTWIGPALRTHGQPLTDLAVARLHASVVPGGHVVHLHDPIAWVPARRQPVTLEAILAAPSADAALATIARGVQASSGNVRAAVRGRPDPVVAEAWWRWPFATGADYLVWAMASRRPTT